MRWPDVPGWRSATLEEQLRMVRGQVSSGLIRLGPRTTVDPRNVSWNFEIDGDIYLCALGEGRVFRRTGPVEAPDTLVVLDIAVWEIVPVNEHVLISDDVHSPPMPARETLYEELLSETDRGLTRAERNVEQTHAWMAKDQPESVQALVGVMLGINRELMRVLRDLHGIGALPAQLPDTLARLPAVVLDVSDAFADDARRDPVGAAFRLIEARRRFYATVVGADRVEDAFRAAATTEDPVERAAKVTEGLSAIAGIVLAVRGLAQSAGRMSRQVLTELEELESEVRALTRQADQIAAAERAAREARNPAAAVAVLTAGLPIGAGAPRVLRSLRSLRRFLSEFLHARWNERDMLGVRRVLANVTEDDALAILSETRTFILRHGAKLRVGGRSRSVTALVELQKGARLGQQTVAVGARSELEVAARHLIDPQVRDLELIPNPPSTHTAPDLLVRYHYRPAHLPPGIRSEAVEAKFIHFATSDVRGTIRRTVRAKHLQVAGRGGSFVFRVERPLSEVTSAFDHGVADLNRGFLQQHRHIRRIEIVAADGTRRAMRRGTSADFFIPVDN